MNKEIETKFWKNYYRLRFRYFYSKLGKNSSFIPSNHSYGHEYWLKKYSGYKKPIMAVIEHGLYLGENGGKMVTGEDEYSIEKIITFGDYNEKTLKEHFPNYEIIKIGPRIAYVKTSKRYYKELKTKAKVLTAFPIHSLFNIENKYDIEKFIIKVNEISIKYGIEEKRCCIYYTDYNKKATEIFKRNGFKIVTAGSNQVDFLPRLRAIIETSDITVSNYLSTNLGYSIYLGIKQFLILQNVTQINGEKPNKNKKETNVIQKNKKNEHNNETDYFSNMFGIDSGNKISKEEYELCDYYWGYSHIKSKKELKEILEALY